jgi:hypothetical protein
MNRVLDHIDSHIDETLEIAPLASAQRRGTKRRRSG